MIRSRILVAIAVVLFVGTWTHNTASAQQIFTGTGPNEAQYLGGGGVDSTGRAVNAEGRSVDRYGVPVDDYGRSIAGYRLPGHTASSAYYSNGYSGLGYSNGLGYSVGLGGYSGGYYSSTNRFGTGVGSGATYIAPPRTIIVGGAYPSRTVMNNATRGGVVEYTNNGNGYVYAPGTSSQTVLSSGPSIFPSTSVVQPSQPPVLIQSRPLQTTSKTFAKGSSGRVAPVGSQTDDREIKLICPKESAAPISYVLNGTVYTIKPGYSQTFAEDRTWTIEFLREGSGSQAIRYDLRAGTYQFTFSEDGWDLKSFPRFAASSELPPSPTSSPAPLAAPTTVSPTLPPPVPAPTPSPDL